MDYTVEAHGLSKGYGSTAVLREMDLALATGSVYGLLGPNGAGKTTLVRILATLLQPDAGSARIAGYDLVTRPRAIRRSISLAGQYAAIDEVLTAQENLVMMGRLRKLPKARARERATELLEAFDLVDAKDRRAGTFSGGMKRRLDLAVSMIERPALLFLDEPTTGLDPRGREQVWATVSALSAQGVTILLTTQYLEEADRLADRIGVLNDGRVVAEGTPAELKDTVGGEIVRLHLRDPAEVLSAVAAFPQASADPGLATVSIATNGSVESLRDVLSRADRAGLEVRRVDTVRPSLDDVFFKLTSRDAA